jgi:hypothetical protein
MLELVGGSCADCVFRIFFLLLVAENSKSDDDVSLRRPPLVLSSIGTSFSGPY